MAVGPTESLSGVYMRTTPEQRFVTSETNAIMVSYMRGQLNARVSPSTAIPPSGSSSSVQDTGVGIFIDIQA